MSEQVAETDEQELISTARAGAERRQQRFGSFGMPDEKSDDFGRTLRRLGELLGRERRLLVVVLALTVASVVLVVVGPLLLGRATDVIVAGVTGDEGIDFADLHRRLVVVAALYIAAWALSYAQAYLLAGVVQRSMYSLREAIEEKLNRLPLRYVDGEARGDLLSRVTNDIDNLAQSLQQTVSQIITSTLTLVGVAVMMFVISPLMAVVALVTVPLAVWAMRRIASVARPRYLDQWRSTGALNAHVEEVFTGHLVVKSFGRQREVEARFREENERLYEASFRAQFVSGLIQPAMLFMGNVQYLLVAVVGGLRIASGAITVGDVQAMIQYARQFSQPLTQLASMATVFQSGLASLERVLELLDAEAETPDPDPGDDPRPPRGRIVFEDVSFSYRSDRPVIEGLDLVAEPGETVAIVGPTGAGKTTLVNLIMRFYDVDGGRITVDGVDITTMPRRDLRSGIGMVLQDAWLFGGTIRANIAYGDPHATDHQVVEAARLAYVDRFAHSLPAGYDTVINDEGDNISAGEKQLITIARAFLADPAILILDEATSAVDTRTEVLVQQAMHALQRRRTSFVIAHRLSTIRGADLIVVMERGRIVEQGSHEVLLARDGAYRRLYESQFAGAVTDTS